MFDINNLTQEISLNRGDTGQFSIFINAGTELKPIQYRLQKNDCLYMAIEEPNQPFEKAIVKKVINTATNLLDEDGNIIVDLESEDTFRLLPGLYYYEIKAKIYRENRYRNLYIVITFNDDFTFNIFNEKTNELVNEGTYVLEDDVYTLITSSDEVLNGTVSTNGILTLSNGDKYKQENNLVETIIDQTRFTIVR